MTTEDKGDKDFIAILIIVGVAVALTGGLCLLVLLGAKLAGVL